MTATKTKISVTISMALARLLEEMANAQNTTKSAIVEKSIRQMAEERLADEAKIISSAVFDDLPSEDEWIEMQPKF
jgi:predicted transcriptional regulator